MQYLSTIKGLVKTLDPAWTDYSGRIYFTEYDVIDC